MDRWTSCDVRVPPLFAICFGQKTSPTPTRSPRIVPCHDPPEHECKRESIAARRIPCAQKAEVGVRRHKWESVYTSRHKWEWLGASCAVSLAMAELSEEAVERPAKRARVEESLRSLIARFKCSITRELLRNGSFYVSRNIRRRRFAIMMRVLVGPCCYCRRAKLRTHGHRAVAH